MKRILYAILFIPFVLYAQTFEDNDYKLTDVVVTATRSETLLKNTPEVIRVITSKEIKKLNPTSVGEILNYVSGINVESGTGSGLPKRSIVNMNGFPANYILVLVDGEKLLSDHIHSGQNLELIPVESIERIEVIRGASSAQYGSDALGGILNIITKKCADEEKIEFNLNAGSYQTYSAGVSALIPISERLKNSAYIGWEKSNGMDIIAPTHRIGNMGYNNFSFMDKINLNISDGTKANANINYIRINNQWQGENKYSYLISPNIGLSHELSRNFNLSAKVSYQKWESEQSEEINELVHPEIVFNYFDIKNNSLHFGVDYKNSEFKRTGVNQRSQYSYGGFIQDEYIFSGKLNVMVALRFDKVESIDLVISPKISVLYKPIEEARFRLSAAKGFHAPTVQELYELGYGHGGAALRFGNENLNPEYSTTFTFGGEFIISSNIKLLLNSYYSRITDMIIPVYKGAWEVDDTKDVWMRENIHEAEMYGAELVVRVNLFDNYMFEGGYTFSENKDEDSGRQLPYNPGSSEYLKVFFTQPISQSISFQGFAGIKIIHGRSAWNWKPASDSGVDDPFGIITKLADYQKFDAGIMFSIENRYSIYLNVYNILGQEVEQLDDCFTVLKGEPTLKSGIKYQL